MLGRKKLSGADRDFFRIVTKSAFSNPFGTENYHLACEIAGGDYKPRDALIQKMTDHEASVEQNVPLDRLIEGRCQTGRRDGPRCRSHPQAADATRVDDRLDHLQCRPRSSSVPEQVDESAEGKRRLLVWYVFVARRRRGARGCCWRGGP